MVGYRSGKIVASNNPEYIEVHCPEYHRNTIESEFRSPTNIRWNSNYLEAKGINCIVNQNKVREVPVDHSEIFHVNSFFSQNTIFPKQAMGNILVFGVQKVKHFIGVASMRCRKDNNLEIVRKLLDDIFGIRPHVDFRLNSFFYFHSFTVGERNTQLHIKFLCTRIVAVDQSFVQIKDQGFLASIFFLLL